MSTPTIVGTGEAVTVATARLDFLAALTAERAFFKAHPGARLPESPVENVRVKGATREERLADLRAIAASWDVPVITLPDGTLTAQLVFGARTIEAHVGPEYATTTAYLEAARARKAAAA